jgi:hypothetical protein
MCWPTRQCSRRRFAPRLIAKPFGASGEPDSAMLGLWPSTPPAARSGGHIPRTRDCASWSCVARGRHASSAVEPRVPRSPSASPSRRAAGSSDHGDQQRDREAGPPAATTLGRVDARGARSRAWRGGIPSSRRERPPPARRARHQPPGPSPTCRIRPLRATAPGTSLPGPRPHAGSCPCEPPHPTPTSRALAGTPDPAPRVTPDSGPGRATAVGRRSRDTRTSAATAIVGSARSRGWTRRADCVPLALAALDGAEQARAPDEGRAIPWPEPCGLR